MTVNHVTTLGNWFWHLQKRTPLLQRPQLSCKMRESHAFCLASAKIWLSHTKFTKLPCIFSVDFRILLSIIRIPPYTANLTQCGEKSLIFSSLFIVCFHHTRTSVLLSHGRHAGVQQHTVVNWEKALSPSLWGDAQSYLYKVRIYWRCCYLCCNMQDLDG